MNALELVLPTFDRPGPLRATLVSLLPQLGPACRLTILDNASPRPAQEILDELGGSPHVQVIRHRFNIGGNANIARCFEVATAEWVWIIGDDDPLVEDGIQAALALIAAAPPNALYIGLAHRGLPQDRTVAASMEEFLGWSARGEGDILFITAGIYRARRLQPRLHAAYQWAATCAPHLVLLLTTWDAEGGSALLVRQDLRAIGARETTGGQAQLVSFCLALLPNLPPAWARSPALARLVARRFLAPDALLYEAFLDYRRGRQGLAGAWRYFHITARLKYPWHIRLLVWLTFGLRLLRMLLLRLVRSIGFLRRPPSADERLIQDRP